MRPKLRDKDNVDSHTGWGRHLLVVTALLAVLVAGIVAAPPATAGQLSITIDKAAQHAYVYDDAKIIKVIPVSTGANDATPNGDFAIYSKSYWATASSEGTVKMQFMSRFLGGYGMHAIPRKNGVPLSTPLGQYPVSHGCVRMADPDAEWVYDNLPIGTPVHIINKFSGTATPPREVEPPPPEGGVPVAAGDLDGDGTPELITGAGNYRPSDIRIWREQTNNLLELNQTSAYAAALPGGVNVAAGDLDGDGKAEVITGAGRGGGPHVRVFDMVGNTLTVNAERYAYDPAFTGGVTVAVGDVSAAHPGNELITGAGPGGGPYVRVWALEAGNLVELYGFYAYTPSFPGGVDVASGNVETTRPGDEIITGAGPGGGPYLRAWSLTSGTAVEVSGMYAYNASFPGGLHVGVGDVDPAHAGAEIIVGPGRGGGPHVRVLELTGGSAWSEYRGFYAYDPSFPGGVLPAAADLDHDGVTEIVTGPGPGGGPYLRIWDPTPTPPVEETALMVDPPTYAGGTEVAAGNLDGGSSAALVTAEQVGGDPYVRVFRSPGTSPITFNEVAATLVYQAGFTGGVDIASGNLDTTSPGDELVTGPGPGGGPHVRVWALTGTSFAEKAATMAYGSGFGGGVHVAVGDLDPSNPGDELVTGPGPGGGPHVRVWKLSGGVLSEVAGFYAYDPAFGGGVNVAVGDIDPTHPGDELITGAAGGGGPMVRVWELSGGTVTPIASFYAYSSSFSGGVDVAAGNVDTTNPGDELITGPGPGGGPHVRVWSLGPSGTTPSELAGFYAYSTGFTGGVHVAAGSVVGGASAEILTGSGPGGRPDTRIFSMSGTNITPLSGFLTRG